MKHVMIGIIFFFFFFYGIGNERLLAQDADYVFQAENVELELEEELEISEEEVEIFEEELEISEEDLVEEESIVDSKTKKLEVLSNNIVESSRFLIPDSFNAGVTIVEARFGADRSPDKKFFHQVIDVGVTYGNCTISLGLLGDNSLTGYGFGCKDTDFAFRLKVMPLAKFKYTEISQFIGSTQVERSIKSASVSIADVGWILWNQPSSAFAVHLGFFRMEMATNSPFDEDFEATNPLIRVSGHFQSLIDYEVFYGAGNDNGMGNPFSVTGVALFYTRPF